MGRITVFSLSSCRHCQRAKALLSARGVPYLEINLEHHPERRADMVALANRATVPQIFLNDRHVGGASDLEALAEPLDAASFDALVKQTLAAPDPTDVRLAPPTRSIAAARDPSPRSQRVVATIGSRSLAYVDCVRLLDGALDIADRAHNLTVYRRCFVGSDFVDTMMRLYPTDVPDRSSAIALGRALLDEGVMSHVVHEHGFEDAYLFYRLTPDATPAVLNGFRNAWTDRVDDPLLTVKHLQKLFGALQSTHTDPATGLVDYAALALDPAYDDFKESACEFQAVDLGAMEETTRLAFLINLYNLMISHAFAYIGAPRTSGGRYTFFDRVKVNVGGRLYSFNDIEQGLIRGNAPAPYKLFPQFRTTDPRRVYSLSSSSTDPRVHFALNCGAKSCPPVKTYTAEALNDELQLAAVAFNEDQTGVIVNADGSAAELRVSMILKWYRRDFGATDSEVATKVAGWLRGKSKEALEGVLAKGGRVKVTYAPYDWTTNGTDNSPEYYKAKTKAAYNRITG